MTLRHYQVVGRAIPTESNPEPQIYRMRLFAANPVTARSRFWYFTHKLAKMKKTTGEILSVSEITEKNTNTIKNYGIWLRYNSRSGTHNMYKEFRDVSLTGAVGQLMNEMNGRHRARERSVQVLRTCVVPAADTKRTSMQQFLNSKVKFPQAHTIQRPSHKRFRTVFKANRPKTFFN
eukprot:g5683.t1